MLLIGADGARRLLRSTNLQIALHATHPTLYPGPTTAYMLDVETMRTIRDYLTDGGILAAIYHSHPNGCPYLSRRDLAVACGATGPIYPGTDQILVIVEGARDRIVAFRWSEPASDFRALDVVDH